MAASSGGIFGLHRASGTVPAVVDDLPAVVGLSAVCFLSGSQGEEGEFPFVAPGIGGSHGDLDPSGADVTRAPILSSLRRMALQLACANWVKHRPMRRSAHSST